MDLQDGEEIGFVISVEQLTTEHSHRTPHLAQPVSDPFSIQDTASIPGFSISLSALSQSLVSESLSCDNSSTSFSDRAFVLAAATFGGWDDVGYPSTGHCGPRVVLPFTELPLQQAYASMLVENPVHTVALETLINPFDEGEGPHTPLGIFATKYKKVADRTKPIPATLPEHFRVQRNITGDPLKDLPYLSPFPPEFTPTGRYTLENKEVIDKLHPGDFLWPEERKLMHYLMMLQEGAFAWDESQKGHFREDFFPPITMPVTEHTPWVHRNIPIPPGLYEQIIKIVRDKIASGAYEPSNSSYRSRWFTVLKKDGVSLRIVHDLQPLNAVTIRDAGVIPFVETLAESFGARACYGVLDLYVAFDQRTLHWRSRDYTTFQTPLGTFRLTKLPMGWTNSVQVLHGDVTYTLQDEIPHVTIPFLDDAGVKGPSTRYELPDGGFELHPENPGVRRFIWEHFLNLNRVIQRIKYVGCTWSGKKAYLCVPEAVIVGNTCTYEGRVPDDSKVSKILSWGPCRDVHDVRAFLGTAGLMRNFIWNYAAISRPLVDLTRKDADFIWLPLHTESQRTLQEAIEASPALRPLDYASEAPVILAVDTSIIAVGFALLQEDLKDPKLRYLNRCGSIAMNTRESNYSQPKLELYGVYRALKATQLWIIGVRNLVLEVDATAIKGMLNNPDMNPSATINRWVAGVLLFHFKLVHVPGITHGVDGLSRRRPFPGEVSEPDDPDWLDHRYSFLHTLNPLPFCSRTRTCAISPFPVSILKMASAGPPKDPADPDDTPVIPISARGRRAEARLEQVRQFLDDLAMPSDMKDAQVRTFVRYASDFFLKEGELWRRDPELRHKLVVPEPRRYRLIKMAHDELGHKGIFSVRQHLLLRFWWPHLTADVAWFVRSCHWCQIRQTQHWHIPPVVAYPAPLFTKAHIDTFFMEPSNGYKAVIHARCSLTAWPEARALKNENANTIAAFIYEELISRWGSLREIVTDNGPPYLKALEVLERRYGIKHIRISGYNSQAQGVIENRHFDVREGLFKIARGNPKWWWRCLYAMLWAERVTVSRQLGMSPYRATTGVEPILPFDYVEATFLLDPPTAPLSRTDLIATRAAALQYRGEELENLRSRVHKARLEAVDRWVETHRNRIVDFDFKRGDIVLLRNSKLDGTIGGKFQERYFGPLFVLSRTRGGAYVIVDLDGTPYARPIAARRVMPYVNRTNIPLPDVLVNDAFSPSDLSRLEESIEEGED